MDIMIYVTAKALSDTPLYIRFVLLVHELNEEMRGEFLYDAYCNQEAPDML